MSLSLNLWLIIALAAGLAQCAGVFLLVRCAFAAPEGYEDARGFHLGREPAPVEAKEAA